jgi:enterochelin esterase-like enzyme
MSCENKKNAMRSILYVVKFFLPILILLFSACSEDKEDIGDDNGKWIIEKIEAPNTEYVVFYSASVDSEVSFHIFFPDEYNLGTSERFPAIYWLHGSGGGREGIEPLVNHFSAAMKNGTMPLAIIVFPHGLPYGMWCDSKDGKQPVESMVINDLIPYIDQNFRTIGSRKGRIVEGFSMGGYGAARFGFKYPELFGGFSMLGAGPMQLDFSVVAPHNQAIQPMIFRDVYGDDMEYFEAQSPWRLAEIYVRNVKYPSPKRLVVGKEDFVYQANLDFHEHLDSIGVSHQYREFENLGHKVLPLFNALGQTNWMFYRAVFE